MALSVLNNQLLNYKVIIIIGDILYNEWINSMQLNVFIFDKDRP